MPNSIKIGLIDDDSAVLDSLSQFFATRAVRTTCFGAAEEFLGALDNSVEFDCVVADVRMPKMSGLDLVRQLKAREFASPVILITGHGDVDMAVRAIKDGAYDFLEKPFDENRLLASIQDAVARMREKKCADIELAQLRSRVNSLSPRQRQVMELAAAGLSSKEIGTRLNISAKTVENHRAWLMERVGARNLADLVRISMRAQQRT